MMILTCLTVLALRAEILSDNMAKTSAGTEAATSATYLAASFGTGSAASTLSSVSLLLRNSTAGAATAALYSDGGLKPGSLIATLTSPATYSSTLSETTFTSSAPLSANTTYWIVLRADSGQFDWSWSANSNGDGTGYQYSWGVSSDSGANWHTYAIYPLQMRVTTSSDSCSYVLGSTSATVAGTATGGSVLLTTGTGCAWTAVSNASWIAVTSATSGSGTATVSYSVSANAGSARTGTITIGGLTYTVNQASAIVECSLSVSPTTVNAAASASSGSLAVTSGGGCSWASTTADSWISITSGATGSGSGTVAYTLQANTSSVSRSGLIVVTGSGATINVSIAQAAGLTSVSSALRFVPVAPCRVMDTRTGEGKSGSFGPPILAAGSTRDVPVPQSGCGVPTTAKAYSVNVTVVPAEPLGYLTLYPTGSARPLVSTLNAFEGQVAANAAIVPAGTNGSISIFVTNNTHAIADINGYFTESTGAETLLFYPVTPCRLADTRTGSGKTGSFGPPSLAASGTRSFPVPQGGCGVPSTAQAYSLNFTVVPPAPLSYITAFPTGQARPLVSTLNSFQGRVLANAAIVPAGTGGSIDVFSTEATDLVLDVNGYFAPAAAGGLSFRTVTPCRIADTRAGQGFSGSFGPPTMAAAESRAIPVAASVCGVPTASAYSLNVTVVPPAPLAYLTLWPSGSALPLVSTLNAFEGQTAANAALVPATAGSVSVFTSNASDVILDINGYFAP